MALDKIIPFQKKAATELPLIKLTFYNTTTKKEEDVEFCDYMMLLEKFGFLWVEDDLKVRYSVELSTDKKKLIKKLTMGRETRKILWIDNMELYNKCYRYDKI